MKFLIDYYIEKYGIKEQNKAKWIEDLRIFGDGWYAHEDAQQGVEPTCSTCGVSDGHKFGCPKYGLPQSVQADLLPCGHDSNFYRDLGNGVYGCTECAATSR